MDKLFKNIVSAFLTPVNFMLYLVIFLYFLAYVNGSADGFSFKIFGIICIVGNLITGIFMTIFDNDNIKSFDEYYIYGKFEKRRNR